ncbi:MAG: hypothetical protein SV377_08505 [Halobacteria archaeon]|nr:hypothetical protein [Halobacteria archaeon]
MDDELGGGTRNPNQETEEEANDDDIALAISFEVLKELQDPKGAVDSAKSWAKYIGVVSDKPTYAVNSYCAKRDIHFDFFSDSNDSKLETLRRTKRRERFDAERYIFIGDTKRDEVIAQKGGWEYVGLQDISNRPEWKPSKEDSS